MGYKLEVDVVVKKRKLVEFTIEKYVGIKIKLLRKTKELSQQDLANKLKVGRSSISNIENGHQGLTLQNLELICKALDCVSSNILPF